MDQHLSTEIKRLVVDHCEDVVFQGGVMDREEFVDVEGGVFLDVGEVGDVQEAVLC